MKMKKIFTLSLVGILLCVPLFLFADCTNPWDIKMEENGFYYACCDKYGDWTKKQKKAVSAVILGRVDNEEYVEELVIPQELGGFPVKQVGGRFHPIEGGDEVYSIDCKNIGKIVINHSCCLKDAFRHFSGELVINADVLLDSASQFVPYSYNTVSKCIRFTVDLQSLTDYERWSLLWDYDWGISAERELKRVEFNADGGRQNTYAYVVQMNASVFGPETPTKEGYTFAGWYNENYETEWNFETDKVTENITLYAKWVAN